MARPERNNVDYFPHPVTHGKKMSYIEKKYGNDGYAVWFKLLEECGRSNFHYIDLQDEVQLMFLEDKCNVSIEQLLTIIDDLVRLDQFDKSLWENEKILFNIPFTETINDAYIKRTNDCITYDGLMSLLISKKRIKSTKSTSEKKPDDQLKKINGVCAEIIQYLNRKAKRKFSPDHREHLKLIKARFTEPDQEGKPITIRQFQAVIDFKVTQSKDDPKKFDPTYLRPETLFSKSNFLKYLEEARFAYHNKQNGATDENENINKKAILKNFGKGEVHQ